MTADVAQPLNIRKSIFPTFAGFYCFATQQQQQQQKGPPFYNFFRNFVPCYGTTSNHIGCVQPSHMHLPANFCMGVCVVAFL